MRSHRQARRQLRLSGARATYAVRTALVVLTASVALAACSTPAQTALPAPSSTPANTPVAPVAATCTNPLASYAPPATMPTVGKMPAGSTMATIAARGRLIVGVSADSYLLGSRNPVTGNIEGFDIDVARQIARAILGPQAKLELRVVSAAGRIPALTSGQVDIVVRNMTITCDRWQQIAFSAEYFHSGQKLLIRKGSGITGFDDLAGRRVCAPRNTTTLTNLAKLAPRAVAVPASTHTECLVDLQQGDVDAITGDDTVLAGLAAQDPYAQVLAGKAITDEPYGVGVPKAHADLAAFINGVLVQMRADGTWAANYRRWLAPTLGPASQPTPQYGRS